LLGEFRYPDDRQSHREGKYTTGSH